MVFGVLFVRLIIWSFKDLLEGELTPGKMEGVMWQGDNKPRCFLLNYFLDCDEMGHDFLVRSG